MDSGTILNVTGINVGSGNSVGASLTLNGGSVTSTGTAQFGTGSGSASGTLNLNSGTLTVPGITKGAVTFNVNFNGGTLKASAANPAFLSSATNANVLAGGAVIDDGGFAITIAKGLASGAAPDGGLTKSGSGTLTLSAANTFNGPTTILAGTLAIGSGAALAPASDVLVSAGARLDLSAVANYAWSPTAALTASGGTTLAAEIRGGTTIDLGSAPVAIHFSPVSFNSDSTHPALVVSQGSINLNGPVTVNNNGASPLSDGTYVLIRQSAGNLSGSPTLSGPIGGQGIAAGRVVFLQSNGGDLELVVDSIHPTTTTIQRHAGTGVSSAYGDALQFDVTVIPSTASGTVEIRNGGPSGLLLGTAAMTGGACTIAIPETLLAVGSHPNIVAVYQGNINHLASTSAPLAPAQSVTPKPLTITNAAASDKYYDGTTAASISGTLAGVENGDTVTLIPSGVFASANPGTNIAVTSTSTLSGASAAKYSLTQPTGLTANIIAANIWTGGAGGTGTNLATGTNYSPTATTTNPYNAIFNGTRSGDHRSHIEQRHRRCGRHQRHGLQLRGKPKQPRHHHRFHRCIRQDRLHHRRARRGSGHFPGRPPIHPRRADGRYQPLVHQRFREPAAFSRTPETGSPADQAPSCAPCSSAASGDITVASNIVPSVPSRMSLAKSGAGTLTLSGANTFSGGTTINGGEIIATTATALGAGAVVNNGTLDLNRRSRHLHRTFLISIRTGIDQRHPRHRHRHHLAQRQLLRLHRHLEPRHRSRRRRGKSPDERPRSTPSATIHVLENATLYTTAGTHNATLVSAWRKHRRIARPAPHRGRRQLGGQRHLAGAITGTG